MALQLSDCEHSHTGGNARDRASTVIDSLSSGKTYNLNFLRERRPPNADALRRQEPAHAAMSADEQQIWQWADEDEDGQLSEAE